MTTRAGDELTWDAGRVLYRASCACGGTHEIWQYGRPWVVNPCSRCRLPPRRPDERRWRREATTRGEPMS